MVYYVLNCHKTHKKPEKKNGKKKKKFNYVKYYVAYRSKFLFMFLTFFQVSN